MDPGTTRTGLAELAKRRRQAAHPGSAAAVDRQRRAGKLTARERITSLADPGSFFELDELVRHRADAEGTADGRPYGDGVVTGHALVNGRPVYLYAQDCTVLGGTMGEAHGAKIHKVMDLAMRSGCPIVGINDSGGARIQDGVAAMAAYFELMRRNVLASGVVPQISLVMGPCAGGAAYSPALTDFVVMVRDTSQMFVTGPAVVAEVTGEHVDAQALGGGTVSATVSGNAHHLAATEADAIVYVRDLLSYLPSNNMEDPPGADAPLPSGEDDPALDTLVPDSLSVGYDMHAVLDRVLDEDSLLEVHDAFAPNIICGFGRIAGRAIGVVANQPLHLAGCLDIDASEKAARFIRVCDAFNLPLLMFVDVPGYLPGSGQEHAGIIRRGAKMLYAYAEATVPKVTVIVRKAYGGGYGVMGSKHLGADMNFAWAGARIAVMGGPGAVRVLHRRALADSADPDALRHKLVDEYERTVATPYHAAAAGHVDMVIRPGQTRAQVDRALYALRTKREDRPPKKHGNMPL